MSIHCEKTPKVKLEVYIEKREKKQRNSLCILCFRFCPRSFEFIRKLENFHYLKYTIDDRQVEPFINEYVRICLQFFYYIFILGTLILILDSRVPAVHIRVRPEVDHLQLCRFYQLHLPQQAIRIALHHRPESTERTLRQALTREPRKYVLHFLLVDGSDEISKIVPA